MMNEGDRVTIHRPGKLFHGFTAFVVKEDHMREITLVRFIDPYNGSEDWFRTEDLVPDTKTPA
jgi:hypothetical protein